MPFLKKRHHLFIEQYNALESILPNIQNLVNQRPMSQKYFVINRVCITAVISMSLSLCQHKPDLCNHFYALILNNLYQLMRHQEQGVYQVF